MEKAREYGMTSGGHEVDMGEGRSPHSNNVLDFIKYPRLSQDCEDLA